MVRLRDQFQNIFLYSYLKSVCTAKKLPKSALVFCGEISYIENIFFYKMSLMQKFNRVVDPYFYCFLKLSIKSVSKVNDPYKIKMSVL